MGSFNLCRTDLRSLLHFLHEYYCTPTAEYVQHVFRYVTATLFYSMLKFFSLDVSLVGGVAVSSGPAPDSAFAPSLFGRPLGQLPSFHGTMPKTSRQVKIIH